MSDRPPSCDVLVLAAFPPELAAFRERLAFLPQMRGGVGGAGFAGEIDGLSVVAAPVGIGLASASAGAALRVASYAPRCAVLVGTCGVYRAAFEEGIGLGAVVAGRTIRLVAPAVVQGQAGFPGPMVVAQDTDPVLRAALLPYIPGGEVDVATTLAITTDDPLAATLSAVTGARAEHLEAFGVAVACGAQGVPFAAVFGVANVVGSTARDEWRAHHAVAGDAAVRAVLAWLDAGAPGLAETRPSHALLA